MCLYVYVYLCACGVHVCVRSCVRACVCVRLSVHFRVYEYLRSFVNVRRAAHEPTYLQTFDEYYHNKIVSRDDGGTI